MENYDVLRQERHVGTAGLGHQCNANQASPFENWPVYHRSIHIHETDQDGVVHFSNYLRIAEEAMFGGFRAFGYSFENTGHSVAMLDARVAYLHPMKFGDQIEVVLTDCAIKRVKFTLSFEFRRNREVCARALLTLVTILIDGRKAIPLPKTIKKRLSTLSEPSTIESNDRVLKNN